MSSSTSNISSCISNISYAYPMHAPVAEYRKIQQKSDGQTLLVTIPYDFAQAIIPKPLQKSDTVKMTLSEDNKRIVVQRVD
jgi:hypothetical protein